MIRFIFRFIGLLLLALAFILVIYDGMRSIADRTVYAMTISEVWTQIGAGSMQIAQATVDRYAGPDVWKLGVEPVLHQPAAAAAAILGVLLILLGRRKKPLIGYARD